MSSAENRPIHPRGLEPDPGPEERSAGAGKEIVKAGISFGTALAIAISWSINQSVLWAILHGFCSWLYVGYHLLFH